MKEYEVADVLCVSERKCRDMREAYLEEGKHFARGGDGIEYTADGLSMLCASLGLDVAMLHKPPEMPQEGLEGCDGAAGAAAATPGKAEAGANGQKGAPPHPEMVRVKICRVLPNARQYVGKVCGTTRVVRVKTLTRCAFKVDRVLWCVDHGDWVAFDRRAARMMGRGKG
jgi:hypothetical protein